MLFVLQTVFLILGVIASIIFFAYDLIWLLHRNRNLGTNIEFRNRRRFYIHFFISTIAILMFLIDLYILLIEHKDTWHIAQVLSLIVLFNLNWKYQFSDKGIKYRCSILSWDNVERLGWITNQKDKLFIIHEKGYFEIDVTENKEPLIQLLTKHIKPESYSM